MFLNVLTIKYFFYIIFLITFVIEYQPQTLPQVLDYSKTKIA